ncbi:hypothetical protein TSTA_042260 [Talaromyces stipitatus ATCC 10500]|uniref:Uncharacterized protein n=1 Tax=Talaromyces stipitatus (strain ATCC 10500 / CBS 375.48 / QM 6759 / NRRL 1006) TaxID=441959 RepID=B8MJT4_TALSN|nr:uncharacterized protein TSTA_042260 [Talaromyces stipitatus ATCC 10500]EED14751.1 hypothetical protein TSTA_042260 [Talaromyces stipitatus ATCC 10500]
MENITFCEETKFGPQVSRCRGNFDFTLFFEEFFLSILLSVLLLLALPVRYRHLYKKRTKEGRPKSCLVGQTTICPSICVITALFSGCLVLTSDSAKTNITCSSGVDARSIYRVATAISFRESLCDLTSSIELLLILVIAI